MDGRVLLVGQRAEPERRTARDLRHRHRRPAPLGRAGRLVGDRGGQHLALDLRPPPARHRSRNRLRRRGSRRPTACSCRARCSSPSSRGRDGVRVDVVSGTLQLDTLLVRPFASRLVLTGDAGSTELVHSSSLTSQPIRVGRDGQATTAVVYDSSGVRGAHVRPARHASDPRAERGLRDHHRLSDSAAGRRAGGVPHAVTTAVSDFRQSDAARRGRLEHMSTPTMTFDERYGVIQSRDPRFDGQFVTAVRSTGIYCRPSCPARTPKPVERDVLRHERRGARGRLPRVQALPARGRAGVARVEPARRHDRPRDAPDRRRRRRARGRSGARAAPRLLAAAPHASAHRRARRRARWR